MFVAVDVENVNGLSKCHYFMSHTDLFIDYWLLSFGSLTDEKLCGAEFLRKNIPARHGIWREIECGKCILVDSELAASRGK